jgi:hypothetical protein
VKQGDADWVRREALAGLTTIAFQEIKTDEFKLRALRCCVEAKAYEAFFSLAYEPLLNGEPWAIDLFFAHLSDVPLQQNFYKLIDLLGSTNPHVGRRVLAFLEKVTGLKARTLAPTGTQDNNKVREAFQKWYAAHYQELR